GLAPSRVAGFRLASTIIVTIIMVDAPIGGVQAMKYMGVAEAKAKLSECIEEAQREPVVILSHGRPAAMVIGLTGMSLDQVAKEDAQLLKVLAERSHSPTIPWKEAKAQLARKRKRR